MLATIGGATGDDGGDLTQFSARVLFRFFGITCPRRDSRRSKDDFLPADGSS
jgi:hypothetical protein